MNARSITFGRALSVQHPPESSQAQRFEEHLEQVRLAEAVGFDSVWASQHYLSAPLHPASGRAGLPAPALTPAWPDSGR